MNTTPLHLLIAEDEAAHVEAVRRAFETAGTDVEIRAVGTLREYRACLAERPPDIALVDLNLPDGKATEVLTHPPENAAFPVLVMTAFGSQEIVVEVMKAGALDYVVKSLEVFTDMPHNVERVLREWTLLQTHKRAENALRALASRQEAVLAAIPDIIMEVDLHKVYTWANRVGVGFYGEDVIGKEAAFYFEGEEEVYRTVQPLFNGDENIICLESWQRRKDGEKRLLHWSCRVLKDLHGHVTGALSTARDITERKRAETEIKNEQALSNTIIDSIPGTFYLLDEHGRYARWNTYQRDGILGKPEDQVAGMNAIDTIHPEDRALIQSRIANVLRDGKEETVEGRVLLRGGPAFIWMLMTGRRMTVAGRPFLVGTGIDITKRKATEQELREAKALTDAIVENIPLMIFLKEATDLRFVMFNRAGEELLGYDRKALLGKNNLDLFPPEQAACFMAKDREALAGHGVVDIPEEPLQTARKGQRILHTQKVSVLGADGITKYLLGISEDITERKQAEAKHEKLQAQFTQAQKMESVGRLAGGVAHDFNNLLMVIMGNAELCRCEIEPGHPIREWLDQILSSAKRSADITRQLLAFARKQTIAPKVLDLNDTVTSMLKLLRHLIGEDINLAWEPGADLRPVKFDPSQIDQILANLCVNARDAIAGVGMITLETGTATIDADYCACHPDAIPGAYVFLAVSDDGCGMDRATLAQIFEPFFTTKGIGEGTGLGLSTVYGIIKQNNGLIDVYSEPGKGTTFKIYLPEMAVEVPATIAASQAEAPRGRGETILLVEDEKSVRVTCDAFLNSLGYKAMVAETPGEALKKTNQHPDDIHVLLTDVVMPGMDGRQLAQRISALKPGVKVLFMSGYTADVIAQRGVLDEGIQYLPKPFTRDDLARKLREVLDPQSGTACIHRLPLTHPDATAPTLDLG